jgi:hypothetical protein
MASRMTPSGPLEWSRALEPFIHPSACHVCQPSRLVQDAYMPDAIAIANAGPQELELAGGTRGSTWPAVR